MRAPHWILWAGMSLLLLGCVMPAMPAARHAQADFALPQTASMRDLFGGTLSVAFPLGWTTSSNPEQLLLTNDRGFLDDADYVPPSGALAIAIAPLPPSQAAALIPDTQELMPLTLLAAFTEAQGLNIFSPPQPFDLGNYRAALALAGSEAGDTLAMMLELDNVYLSIIAVAAPGELDRRQPMIRAIVSSASYQN